MQGVEDRIVYKTKTTGEEVMRFVKAIGLPIGCLILGMFTVNIFGAFGEKLITPLFASCWVVSVLVALFMPNHRADSLEKCEKLLIAYCVGLLALRFLNAKVSGVSTEMLMATYNEVLPTATGNAMAGFVQSMLWIFTVSLPLGFITYQGKRFIDFRRNKGVQTAFERIRSIRPSKND